MFLSSNYQLQREHSSYQKTLAETTQIYEEKITTLTQQLKEENSRLVEAEEQVNSARRILNDQQNTVKVNVCVDL